MIQNRKKETVVATLIICAIRSLMTEDNIQYNVLILTFQPNISNSNSVK